ncbi:MAG TPA: ATP-binding protein [Labilithrix sp.]|nr:ATP-binding protein [Labilithrix sp.]
MRIRVIFIAAVSFLIWLQQFVRYEDEIFSSRVHSLAYRASEAFVCVGLLVFLWRPRPLRQVEWTATAGFSLLAIAHAFAILVVKEACVVPFTLTAEWGQLVIVLVALLSFRSTLALLTVTWVAGTLATSIRAQWDTDMSDHAILLGIYAVVVMSVRAVDKLRRSEFTARVRLGEAVVRLKQAEEVRGRLFVNLSHDFRTPLALIHAETEVLGPESSPEARRNAIDRIRAHAMSLADLTNQLLELARLEAGKTPLRTESFDIGGVARDVAAQFEPPGTRAIRVLASGGEDAVVGVSADVGHVRRILANLVANAVRNLPAGGEVRIVIALDATTVQLDVVDDGPGINPSRRLAIFERFASFDVTGSVASGIGLPVARELAELNGGSLELVADAPSTTFRVRLPRATVPVAAVRLPERAPKLVVPEVAQTPSAWSPRAGRSLVIVEDHHEMRRLLSELLRTHFAVRLAASCAEARAEITAARPSAVLCDVLLPDGYGYEVLEWVRAQRRLDGVPLLFLSALGTPEQRTRGIAAGADDYITKPFSTEELVARLDAACTRAEERSAALESLRLDMLAELHDGVTASLSRAALLLAGAARPEKSTELVSRAQDAVREGLAEARSIMSLTEGGVASWEEVIDALKIEIDGAANAHSTSVTSTAENDGSARLFSILEAHTLRRIAREALTNAIKHGGARVQCAVVVQAGEASIIVDNEADGARRGDGSGRGLGIAERRVRSLGGTLSLASRAGGTTLRARFPLQFGLSAGLRSVGGARPSRRSEPETGSAIGSST